MAYYRCRHLQAMTKEEETTLHELESRVRQMILQYQDLEAENIRLREAIAEKDEAIKASSDEIASLKESYNRLQTAKMMEIGDEDIKVTKSKLDRLIRDIDKCIALLNV